MQVMTAPVVSLPRSAAIVIPSLQVKRSNLINKSL